MPYDRNLTPIRGRGPVLNQWFSDNQGLLWRIVRRIRCTMQRRFLTPRRCRPLLLITRDCLLVLEPARVDVPTTAASCVHLLLLCASPTAGHGRAVTTFHLVPSFWIIPCLVCSLSEWLSESATCLPSSFSSFSKNHSSSVGFSESCLPFLQSRGQVKPSQQASVWGPPPPWISQQFPMASDAHPYLGGFSSTSGLVNLKTRMECRAPSRDSEPPLGPMGFTSSFCWCLSCWERSFLLSSWHVPTCTWSVYCSTGHPSVHSLLLFLHPEPSSNVVIVCLLVCRFPCKTCDCFVRMLFILSILGHLIQFGQKEVNWTQPQPLILKVLS